MGSWRLVLRHHAHNVVRCKWVFDVKEKRNGSLEKYKAHLVAKGYHQRLGVDFVENFLLQLSSQLFD